MRFVLSARLSIGITAGVFVAFALAATASSDSQFTEASFVLQSWDRREGLPPAVINEIRRGPNGFLWLATQRGLVRFDGDQFRLFNTNSNPEFRTNRISCVLANEDGGVWVGTQVGLFYRAPDRFGTEPWAEIGSRVSVKALAPDKDGVVWVLSGTQEVIQFSGGKQARVFPVPGGEPMRILINHPQQGLLAASRTNAMVLRDGEWLPLPRGMIEQIRPDFACARRQGGFWVAAGRRIASITESDRGFELQFLQAEGETPESDIYVLLEDQAGRIWAGTRDGTVHCIPDQEPLDGGPVWRQVTPKRLRSLGQIACLYEDFEGLVWVGTSAGYLHQIKSPQVSALSLPALTQENVPQTVCVARDGALWLGTDGAGAYRFVNGAVERFGVEQGLSSSTVVAIIEDRQTNLWFGTFAGLYRLEDGRIKPELEDLFGGKPVPALFQQRNGDLWFGTQGLVVQQRQGQVTTYSLGSEYETKEVRAFAEAPKGTLWVGVRGGGLFRVRNGTIEKYARFRHAAVQALHCDSKGVLWVGTATRGLFRVFANRLDGWSKGDGLPSSWVHSIVEDSSGTLWLSSNEGIFGVMKPALMARAASRESPLLTIQVASSQVGNWSAGSGQPSCAKGPDGRLWFPTGHGVLAFDPEALMRKRPALPIVIEELLADGVPCSFDETGLLKLYIGVRRLELRYTIADLDSPGKLRFRYKLEGLDDRWVDAGAQRSATYGPLSLGNYRFRVISAGSANVWTEMGNPIKIEIVPRFWQTASFQGLTCVAVLSAVGLTALVLGRAKLRRKLERLEMQQAMEKERRRIAQDLHDDLGSGISEIVFLSELARQEQRQSPEQAAAQLQDITYKARQIATAMDEIVWTVNPKNDSLPDLASYLCDYAREFLKSANVPCRIELDENLPDAPLTAQQRHNLFMAVKEALNNAVKHSGASEIWLRIGWDATQSALVVTVEDDGRGFKHETAREQESGNGLENMQSRLEGIGGKTEFMAKNGKGTKVCFTLSLVVTITRKDLKRLH